MEVLGQEKSYLADTVMSYYSYSALTNFPWGIYVESPEFSITGISHLDFLS